MGAIHSLQPGPGYTGRSGSGERIAGSPSSAGVSTDARHPEPLLRLNIAFILVVLALPETHPRSLPAPLPTPVGN